MKYTTHINCDDRIKNSNGILNQMIQAKKGEYRRLALDNFTLQIQTVKGQLVAKDSTCDSAFMLSITEEIGEVIHATFHWIPRTKTIDLFVDNTGGHGTSLAKMDSETS